MNGTMKQKMVTTNLRIPEMYYGQMKAIAGELGMSVNEFVGEMIKNAPLQAATGGKPIKVIPKNIVNPYQALIQLAKTSEKWVWKGELSEDDEVIYG